MILYGIAGTNGSGKDSLAEFLTRQYGFLYVSSSDLLRLEATKRGLSIERENLRTISAQWRRESGLGVLVERAVELYNSSPGEYKGLITGSLRNPAEVDAIHAHGGTMLWTDGDPHIRFGRLQGRGRADDPTTYEKFIQDEAAEMHSTGDSATLRMADVKKLADIFIDNDASTMQEFFEIVREALGL